VFSGGSGRGERVAALQAAPIASNIFFGGGGRGEKNAAVQPAAIATNIFSGGSGRGEVGGAVQPAAVASNIFLGGIGRGDLSRAFDPRQFNVLIAVRGLLEGPYNLGTALMDDGLRTAGVIPAVEPYTALGYTHVGGGGATVAPGVLTAGGSNAIVDWVVVELRDATTPSTVLATRSALLQRDGNVVAMDGVSSVTFTQTSGTYFIALRHRNHLSVMTASAVALGSAPVAVDFSSGATATFGTQARKAVGGGAAQVLWAGDVTFNGQIKYTGSGNDRDPILVTVGSTTPNNVVSNTYSTRDVNMNGQVKYTGTGNDRDPILVNVGSPTPNNVRTQQLP
jgi:hypothetical protein